ncbi:IS3 family transposase [bacterium]|nr:IS3 family transposase [bacterium]
MIELLCKRTGASIRTVCQTMELPRSSYYLATTETPSQKADRNIGLAIQRIFRLHRSRYGHRRIWRELRDEGIVCSPSRVSRLVAKRGLRAIQPRTFVPRTSDGRADKPADNLLKVAPKVERNDQIWVGDITFIPTSSRWSYLAIVMDLYSRRIVGWSLTTHLRASLVVDAWSESFMGTLKKEILQGGVFESQEDARIALFEYIEGYYNTQRKHSSIGYQSPVQFERNNQLN